MAKNAEYLSCMSWLMFFFINIFSSFFQKEKTHLLPQFLLVQIHFILIFPIDLVNVFLFNNFRGKPLFITKNS